MPELRAIRRIWVHDKHEFDDSLPRIYKEVIGKEFDDPEWIGSESFGEEEWKILLETCHDLYPDEELMPEMMSSLIDTELQANGTAQRRGLLKNLDRCIQKTFYKNEEDATKYYTKKIVRRKETGGEYNEKFLQSYEKKDDYATAIFDREDVDA